MEKICTRCNFRTPAARAVCQVCGYTKFLAANANAVVTGDVKETSVVSTALAAFNRFALAIKDGLGAEASAERQDETQLSTGRVGTSSIQSRLTEVFKDGDDLDSMIAWFKSYGVDRPLILERVKQPSDDGSRAA